MRLRALFWMALFLGAAPGCAGIGKYTTVARLKETKYEPTEEVEFFEGKAPPRSYDVIAKLETKIAPDVELGELYDSMRAKAKEIGADAVINVNEAVEILGNRTDSFEYPWIVSTTSQTVEKMKVLRGEAIKYK